MNTQEKQRRADAAEQAIFAYIKAKSNDRIIAMRANEFDACDLVHDILVWVELRGVTDVRGFLEGTLEHWERTLKPHTTKDTVADALPGGKDNGSNI